MDAEKLTGRIAADARQRVQELTADAASRASEIARRAEEEVARLEAENRERIARDSGMVMERARSQARLDAGKALLAARWQVIDAIIERAARAVLADAEYHELVAGLVKRHATAGSVVRMSADDTRRLGRKPAARLGEPAAIRGGILVRQGRTELDLSLDALLAAVREELATELARMTLPES